jgi:mono/diheme cytochrome c family protein
MTKTKIFGIGLVTAIAASVVIHFVTMPPAPPAIPPVPDVIAVPTVPALTAYDMPTGDVPVSTEEWGSTLRSVSMEQVAANKLDTGNYTGTPYWKKREKWFTDNFYNTLAARRVWNPGTSPETHKRGGPVTWTYEPIPQYVPEPCDKPQKTGYDAEGCRYVLSLFKDLEAQDPEKAKIARDQVRRGRDVWFKGTFGNQDENMDHVTRNYGIGKENMYYAWLDTRTRKDRFTKWGLINDPDCVEGDASTNWYDKCQDPHSSGVLGYRKYYKEQVKDKESKVVYDPATAAYEADEIKQNKRFHVGHACVQCHVSFDPTRPPANAAEPKWANLSGTIGAQYTNQPHAFFTGVPRDNFAVQVTGAARIGTVDTSLNPNDFMHNPGTQNNIMDFANKRVFEHKMRDPVTGKISTARTRLVLKGGEDSVGEHLALIRVYVNIGLCTEDCWVPNFPHPGKLVGQGAEQSPMRIMQCAAQCDPWNYTDSKMEDLAAFLLTSGPTYLLAAKDQDGSSGEKFVDKAVVPKGHDVFARECASCHSSKVAPQNVRADKNAMAKFYEGHVFGKEDYWKTEFAEAQLNDVAFVEKYFVKDANGTLRPKQFADAQTALGLAELSFKGQDWLSNDERTSFKIIGTNMCRALHDNHNKGHIWEEFASETYRETPSPGTVKTVINRILPGVGGIEIGEKKIEGGPGYYKTFSLLSAWATAPFLHNNAIGENVYRTDGSPDFTVAARVKMFEMAYDELMMSDSPDVTPHRPRKVTVATEDFKVGPQEDGHGFPKLPFHKGTPIANLASANPHAPVTMKCDDPVENKGHQFGVDLSKEEKRALREFLKMM